MSDDPFSPIGGKRPSKGRPASEKPWTIVSPVPADAPAPPREHPSLGLPSVSWEYRDADSQLLGLVHRFEEQGGGKSFRPCCLFRHNTGRLEWRWEAWPEPRPLYALDRLGDAQLVIVAEGEKSAERARELTGLAAVTSPSGSKSAGKANWQPLSGREVVIWPDADEAGAAYAATVTKLLRVAGVRSVRIIRPPEGATAGWDAADALEEGWTRDRALKLIDAAEAPGEKSGSSSEGNEADGGRRPRQRDALVAAADGSVLWHSPTRVPYASVPINGHFEHMPVRSGAFEDWLAGRYYEATGMAPSGQMLSEGLRVLAVRAIQNGPEHVPELRTAWHDGASWLDLGDDQWRAVRIDATGWQIVERPPVKFIRPLPMKALPDPEAGGLIEELRGYVNAEETDYRLIVSWLIATMWGRSTVYPILALGGEQGSGKTTMARMLRTICDPSAVPALAPPKDERDLITMALSAHVISFDNVSKVDNWLSDAICRLSTFGGFLTRKLHSDGDPYFFEGTRPIILNGIPSLTERADLAERSLTVRLLTIDEEGRQAEDDWWQQWEAALPRILGALLDALSAAVRKYDQVKLKTKPRMGGFAKLMTAVEESLGWEPGSFLTAYDDNRSGTNEAAFESDQVAMAVYKFMQGRVSWEGTATMLLDALNDVVSDDTKRSRSWPIRVNTLGTAIQRAAPLLRGKKIDVTHRRAGDARTIVLSVRQ